MVITFLGAAGVAGSAALACLSSGIVEPIPASSKDIVMWIRNR
ncbi:hypothetical protein [Tropheryma whipplei]|nr:hypothetical protein [Tropheryma whipplei]